MNSIFVYCEIGGTTVAEVSQELLTKGRALANQLSVELHALTVDTGVKGNAENQILPYGVGKLLVFNGGGSHPCMSTLHMDIMVKLSQAEQPQICLTGTTVTGRDLEPRMSSPLTNRLTTGHT